MSQYNIDNLNTDERNTTIEENRDGNIVSALFGGLFSCIAVSSIWALITVNAEKQWLLMGIFAGLAVGWFVKTVSGGNNSTVGFIGALFALLSCVLGDFLTNVGFIAQYEDMEYFQTLGSINFSYLFEVAFLDFDFFSIIIYGLAAIEGWVCGRGLNID